MVVGTGMARCITCSSRSARNTSILVGATVPADRYSHPGTDLIDFAVPGCRDDD